MAEGGNRREASIGAALGSFGSAFRQLQLARPHEQGLRKNTRHPLTPPAYTEQRSISMAALRSEGGA